MEKVMCSFKKKILISLGVGVLTFIISFVGILNGVDYVITDLLYQRPVAVNNRIKIIAIDEKSLSELGAFNTWDRALYAKLLNVLYEDKENSPEIVTFDMIFQGETNDSSDKAFAEAAKNAGGVIVAANMVFSDKVEINANGEKYLNRFHTELVEYPYDELMKSTVDIGFADSIQDGRDSRVREYYIKLSDGENEIKSLSYATAKALEERGEIDIKIPNMGVGEKLIMRYSGKPGDYEAISFSDVINGKVPKEAFKDSIIFVGAYAPGMLDAFGVPTDRGSQMYGVEIHANILQSMIDGRYMEKVPLIWYSIVYGAIAFAFMLIGQLLPLYVSVIIGVILIAIQMVFGSRLAEGHLFLPLITLPICLVLSEVGLLGYRYFSSQAQKRKVLKAFKQYVAPQIVEEISKKGEFELKLGGQKRDIAVLFVDIRGFTPLSEALEPEQVVEVLNEYLSLTTKSIFDNMGTLDKFVGDATMAVFNSLFDLDDYIYRAVCAARDIVAGSEGIRKKAYEMTGKEVGFGVGVNCGPAVVGNIGCDFRMDYTAIGDTVNTAARLEANAKAGQVLVSQTVVDALGDRIKTKPIGEIPLKGKSVPLMVYEVIF